MKKINDTTIALLIDGDNAAPQAVWPPILEEVSKDGHHHHPPHLRRLDHHPPYRLERTCSTANAIQPVQQFAYTTGKNSYGQRADHRRHGHPPQRSGGCLLHRKQRQRLHAAWQPACAKAATS
jgi:hypothetical protein